MSDASRSSPASSPLVKGGLQVLVEAGAGVAAGFVDAAYTEKGAEIAASRADVVGRGRRPAARACAPEHPTTDADLAALRPGQSVIAFLDPLTDLDLVRQLADRKVSAFSMELMPRITRAQSMDALSSMATIAGYKAVLIAAGTLPRMFPMLMTAAGNVSAARAFVIGAGVAGLQAIATARKLGAVVQAYDVRGGEGADSEPRRQGRRRAARGRRRPGQGGLRQGAGRVVLPAQREAMAKVVAGATSSSRRRPSRAGSRRSSSPPRW